MQPFKVPVTFKKPFTIAQILIAAFNSLILLTIVSFENLSVHKTAALSGQLDQSQCLLKMGKHASSHLRLQIQCHGASYMVSLT
jgi:hypothetical protein